MGAGQSGTLSFTVHAAATGDVSFTVSDAVDGIAVSHTFAITAREFNSALLTTNTEDCGNAGITCVIDEAGGFDNGEYTNAGTFFTTMNATDANGMTGTYTFSTTIANAAPSVTAPMAPTDTIAQDEQSFSFTVPTDRDGTITQLVIDWGDGSKFTFDSSALAGKSAVATTHEYAEAGEKTITVTAYDNSGDSTIQTTTIEVGDRTETMEGNSYLYNLVFLIGFFLLGAVLSGTSFKMLQGEIAGDEEMNDRDRQRLESVERRMEGLAEREELLEVSAYDASRAATKLEEHISAFNEVLVRAQEIAAEEKLQELEAAEVAREKEEEQIQLDLEDPDIEMVAERFHDSLGRLVKARDELSKIEEQLAHIDPGDLGDAILNLVINARDSMPQGGQLIIETSHCKLDELYCLQNSGLVPGSYIQIVISDTGTGILPEQQERIFEPFFTTKSQGKGTGLGLAMTFGFAQRSVGTIKVYSELGLGTTFRLYLPLAEGEEEKNSPLLDHTLLPRGTENVLIVEDEPELLKLAQHYLIDLGYKVSCAENGVIALELLKKQPEIDLLFSDVVMPGGINGYQLAEMALALQPTIKILLTSGYTGRAIRNTEQAIFETKLISKPYTVNELSTQIRAVLGSPREEQREQDFDKKISETKLGVECYDQEHSQIMAFYERSKQLENGYIDADMSQLLIKITEYASNHLPLEETLMEACQYPGLSNHKQVHSLLLKQLELIKSRAQTGNLSANALSTFLADWWLDHILSMDSSAMTHCKQYPDTVERIVESHQSETNSKNHPDT